MVPKPAESLAIVSNFAGCRGGQGVVPPQTIFSVLVIPNIGVISRNVLR